LALLTKEVDMSVMLPLYEQIETTDSKGRKAIIKAINTSSTDCFHGAIVGEDGKEYSINWDMGGLARNSPSECNIDFRKEELMYLKETAMKLLPDEIKRFL
jgi:hypothetical protein